MVIVVNIILVAQFASSDDIWVRVAVALFFLVGKGMGGGGGGFSFVFLASFLFR